MDSFYYSLLSSLIAFIVISVVCTFVLWYTGASPYLCKKIYQELPTKTFYHNDTCVYDVNLENYYTSKDYFIWFLDDNSFKLKKGVYLHNFFPTYFSPIHLYWLIKYLKWFKENVDINNIEKF